MNNGDKPAFLEKIIEHPRGGNEKSFGFTKREYFAAMAMQGLLSNPSINRPHPDRGLLDIQLTEFSNTCIEYADSLLKQLEQ